MNQSQTQFTLEELCSLVDLPRRTVRYYIQLGLLARPIGAGRGAHYSEAHLQRLLEIRKWQQAGLSLERIAELLEGAGSELPSKPRQPGAIEVWSHLLIADGLELKIEPQRAGLSSAELRQFSAEVMALYEKIRLSKESVDE